MLKETGSPLPEIGVFDVGEDASERAACRDVLPSH